MRIDYLKQFLFYIILGWLLLILGRIGFILTFVPFSTFLEQHEFLPLALWNAFRFDMQTLAYIAAVPCLLCIIASYLKKSAWLQPFLRWYYACLYTTLCILFVADMCFYKNFHDHFNVTMFDFFNEEPLSLIQAFWEEYPVLWILVGIVIFFTLLLKIRIHTQGTKRIHFIAFIFIVLEVVAIRGSIGEFPLQVEDMYVSPCQQINDCVPTPTYCIKKALHEKNTAFDMVSEEELLKRYGFKHINEAWQALGILEHSLFTTQMDSTAQQPDIVILLSESWSGYLIKYALETRDDALLCGMRKHLESDILFLNYQSVHNGTIATLENLLISTSFPRVFTSKYRYLPFTTSFVKPFQQSGYEVTFLSGMDEGWQNLGSVLKTLGVRKIFKYELLDVHPEYEYNSIGIFDHYVMNSLVEFLQKPSRKPRLILVMTTTNHPPFVYPDDIRLPELMPNFYNQPFLANPRDVEEKYIKGFQYANYSMAWFLDWLKSSKQKDNTIVLMTGDHNVRTALKYADDGKCVPTDWEHRVPLYMFVPDAKPKQRPNTWGSHYDILTTLAPFAFTLGTTYLNVGQNLLSDTLNSHNSYSYNVEGILSDKQNKDAKQKANARELLLRLYLQNEMTSYSQGKK